MKLNSFFWRTRADGPRTYLQMFIQGILTIVDGCLMVVTLGFYGSSFAISWCEHCTKKYFNNLRKNKNG